MSAQKKLDKLKERIESLHAEIANLQAEKDEFNKVIDEKIREEAVSESPYFEYDGDLQRLSGFDGKIRKAEISVKVLESELPKHERAAQEERAEALRKELRKLKDVVASSITAAEKARLAYEERKNDLVQEYKKYVRTFEEFGELMKVLGSPILTAYETKDGKNTGGCRARIQGHDDLRLHNEEGMYRLGLYPQSKYFPETGKIDYTMKPLTT